MSGDNKWIYGSTSDYVEVGEIPAEVKQMLPALAKYSQFMANPVVRVANIATSCALTYHGYKRNGGSVFWAIMWGVFTPNLIGLPIALAQGFGKRA